MEILHLPGLLILGSTCSTVAGVRARDALILRNDICKAVTWLTPEIQCLSMKLYLALLPRQWSPFG